MQNIGIALKRFSFENKTDIASAMSSLVMHIEKILFLSYRFNLYQSSSSKEWKRYAAWLFPTAEMQPRVLLQSISPRITWFIPVSILQMYGQQVGV